jgi:NAD(P)-dependent dehydrogenase (short-subunit alcohol dehydrogenase family)
MAKVLVIGASRGICLETVKAAILVGARARDPAEAWVSRSSNS